MKCGKCGALLPLGDFNHERLLLCEGAGDAALLRALLDNRGLADVHIRAAADFGAGGGRDCFGKALRAAHVATGFDKIKKIVIAADCDHDRNTSFLAIKQHLDALGFVPSPNAPDETAVSANQPNLTVLMIPTDVNEGSIDTLAYAAAASNNANERHVEVFAGNAGVVPDWLPQKQAKMKLRSLIACTHQRNPDIPLSLLWSQNGDYLVPIASAIFDPLFARISRLLA